MFLYHGSWHYDFTINGKRYRGSTGTADEEKAKNEIEKIRVQAREGHTIEMMWQQTKRRMSSFNDVPMNFDSIWKEFLKRSDVNACKKRMNLYYVRTKNFCEFINKNYPGVTTVSQITKEQAESWVISIRKKNLASSTKNDYLKIVRFVFHALGKESGIVEQPFDEIKKIKEHHVEREAFTPKELELIGKNATGWIYSLCLTAISTGLREGDICTLKKSCVNLDDGWITIKHTRKTGAKVDIPILPGLKRHLQEVMLNNDSEYVYPELANLYLSSNSNIGIGIKKFFKEIGIEETVVEVDGYHHKVSVKDVHSFRHTFVYLAACHGVPFPIVQGIVGHMNPAMTKHYMDHAGRDAKAQYMAQLPDYLSGQKEIAPKQNALEQVKQILNNMTDSTWQKDRQELLALLPQVSQYTR